MSKTIINDEINNQKYRFSELFDLNEIQKIQDSFSAATGVASFITEPDGTPITKPSGFCGLCNEIIRNTEIGLKNCMISDSIVGHPREDGPRIQRCLSGGLIDAGVSIIVGGKHIANWLVGQVLDEDYKIEDLLSYADVIGVNRDVYKKELIKVKRMSKIQFEHICNFLFLNAHLLSMGAMKNIALTHEINKKTNKETEISFLNVKLEIAVKLRTKQLEELNAKLEETNAVLEEEIAERQKVQEEITQLNNKLEEKVRMRTLELEKVNTELKKSEENTRHILNSTAEAIYGIDLHGNCTFCNTSCLKMLGYKQQEELIGKNMHWQIHYQRSDGTPLPVDECQIYEAIINGRGTHVEDEVLWRADGTCFPAEYFSYPRYHNGEIIGAVVTFMEITERKKAEEEIIYLSYHDQLTGLYNRRFFEEELKRLDVDRNYPLTIVMGDVNGLKQINDSFGHAMGDALLKKTAGVIAKGCRKDDIITRIGGDEFVILLPKTDAGEAERIIKRIKNMASKEKICSVGISISFGYATKNNNVERIQEILKQAEAYMYKKKRECK